MPCNVRSGGGEFPCNISGGREGPRKGVSHPLEALGLISLYTGAINSNPVVHPEWGRGRVTHVRIQM